MEVFFTEKFWLHPKKEKFLFLSQKENTGISHFIVKKMFILSQMKCFAWPHIKVFRFFPICLGNPKKKKRVASDQAERLFASNISMQPANSKVSYAHSFR